MQPYFSTTKHVQTKVPVEVHKALHNYALDSGVSLADLMRHVLEHWVESSIKKEVTQNGEEIEERN
jgi:predicted HicB family RNase H-like nuclease